MGTKKTLDDEVQAKMLGLLERLVVVMEENTPERQLEMFQRRMPLLLDLVDAVKDGVRERADARSQEAAAATAAEAVDKAFRAAAPRRAPPRTKVVKVTIHKGTGRDEDAEAAPVYGHGFRGPREQARERAKADVADEVKKLRRAISRVERAQRVKDSLSDG